MKGISKTAHAGFSPLVSAVLAPPEVMTQAPPGFIPPPLNPAGARLETKELAPGVFGLLSNKLPVDNSGFVVGEHGVLVIDAHINGAMAGLIQTAVRQVTNKPILYVVNTNYHGDHTFGNYAFPQETLIVAQQKTAESMRDLSERNSSYCRLWTTIRRCSATYDYASRIWSSMSTWSWIWAAGWWNSTTSVTAIRPATPSSTCPRPGSPGRAT
jgi:Metallo-beta-lactamase superfamily